ncbi:MAG: DUF4386 domain-containing protein, partial [Flammeovirgaceae bacterium]|nr:DUF4386 domain-containing protein [Flammeovirgaceae bacterium]
AIISVPISMVNLLNKFAILTFISKANLLTGTELQTQILLYLDYSRNGNQLASVFWGLWLIPFGYLVFKSGFIPRILGILLIAGGIGYTIDFVGGFLFTTYNSWGISSYVTLPANFGEIGTCLWLLIVGTWDRKKSATSSITASTL